MSACNTVQACVSRYTRSECLSRLETAGITTAPVNSVPEALKDPQVSHRAMVVPLDHPTAGNIRVTGL